MIQKNKLNKLTCMMCCAILLAIACTNTKKKDKENAAIAVKLQKNEFSAVSMPNELITGNTFPTDSVIIGNWIANSKTIDNLETNKDIINHGWAIWSALTEFTDQKYNNQKLRRFETWYTPEDIKNAYNIQNVNKNTKLPHVKRGIGKIQVLNQMRENKNNPQNQSIVGFVKYDPSAAKHIFDDSLFYEKKLKSYLRKNKIANIPDFPLSGVVLKPVFAALTKKKETNGMFTIPVWPGDEGNPNRAFGSDAWNNNVYVTINDSTKEQDSIYSVKEFIHFQIDKAQAEGLNEIRILDDTTAKAGDYAILLGMHVTTRETKRWTWQTYWWSQNPDNPFGPSSSRIAGLRPDKQLDKAAKHYAMSIAYSMVQPEQPYTGGSGKYATSVYAYNPYLEAGFDQEIFYKGDSVIQKYYPPNYQMVGNKMNKWGMQTNCMSCHGQARYIPGLYQDAGHFYITDQYFSLDAPYFKNTVKLDFTWSIQGNLITDTASLKYN